MIRASAIGPSPRSGPRTLAVVALRTSDERQTPESTGSAPGSAVGDVALGDVVDLSGSEQLGGPTSRGPRCPDGQAQRCGRGRVRGVRDDDDVVGPHDPVDRLDAAAATLDQSPDRVDPGGPTVLQE